MPRDLALLALEHEWLSLERQINNPALDDEEGEGLCHRQCAIEERIVHTPALTVEGVAVKLRLFTRLADNSVRGKVAGLPLNDLDWEFAPAVAALHDLERFTQPATIAA